jgi:hypothetical protein
MRPLIVISLATLLVACGSAPEAPQPSGTWQPINRTLSK